MSRRGRHDAKRFRAPEDPAAPAVTRAPQAAASPAPDRRASLVLLLTLLAAVQISQASLLAPLRTLPSPLYGGDLYYQLGCVQRILDTGDPMTTCSTCETRPGYLPFYGTVVALAARATGLADDPERAMRVMAVVFKLAAVLAMFALLAPLAGGPAAVAGAALACALRPEPILRYTGLATEVIAPLVLLALLRLLAQPRMKRALVLGGAIGVAGYTHAVIFLAGIGTAALAAVGRLVAAPKEPETRRVLIGVAVAAALGIVLALGYWYEPIFVLHGRTSPHYTEWNGGPTLTTLSARLAMAGAFFARQLDFSSLASGIASLAAIAGLAIAWRRRREPVVAAALLVVGAALFYGFHYFVTEPLAGVNFVPEYAELMVWGNARLLPATLALAAVVTWARSPRGRVLLAGAITLGLIGLALHSTSSLAARPEFVAARTPRAPVYDQLRRWVRANTRSDDVFLSAQELSFMLSALTGRQVLVTRRAQNDAFADMDSRVLDAALVLYGTDEAKRADALQRRKIRWLFWSERWLASEFDRGPAGDVTGYFDPLLTFQNDRVDSILNAAGVRLRHVTGWVDPTLRTPDVRQFPLSIVSHENYRSFARPWNAALDPRLRKVWAHEEAGREVAAIYSIDPN